MNSEYSLIALSIISMCIIASGIILSRNLISSLIMSSIFSLIAVIGYVLMKAPDVAITEVTVGSAISTIFLLLTIGSTGSTYDNSRSILNSESRYKNANSVILKTCTTLALFITLSRIVTLFPRFGNLNSIPNTSIGQFYVSFASQHFNVKNVVTSVLGGYRGFDTLIETTVGFCAALGVNEILRQQK